MSKKGRWAVCRLAIAVSVVVAVALVAAGAAWAHASISPPVAKAKVLQQYTLSVPTEKEGATTTKIQLSVPDGFAIDSFEPAKGWKRAVQATGSGEEAKIHSVTWSGGAVPTAEDAVFRFSATADSSKTYKFTVRQTYSDGSVVDWSGPESSDTPAPLVQALSSFGGSSSTLAVVALVVAAVAVLIGIAGLVAGRKPLV